MNKHFAMFLNHLVISGLAENQAQMAKLWGISKSRISDMKAGTKPLSRDFVHHLANLYPWLNEEFLLDDRCELMLKSQCVNGNGNNTAGRDLNLNGNDQTQLIETLIADKASLQAQVGRLTLIIENLTKCSR